MGRPSRLVGRPCIVRFLKLPRLIRCSRARLRGRVVSGLRRFLLRLNGKFAFIKERIHLAFRRRRFEYSLMFCGHLLEYFMLFSLGVKRLGRRSVKRVRVCMGCCSEGMGLPSRGGAVNMVLYGSGGGTVMRVALPRSGARVFTDGCRAILPDGRRLRELLGTAGWVCF